MLTTLIAADSLPVTRAEAKAHLHIDDDNDDASVDLCLLAAIQHVQKQCGGLVLAPTTLRESFEEWPAFITGRPALAPMLELSAWPVRDVLSVTYLDEDGAEQDVVEANNWSWQRTVEGAFVRFWSGFGYPTLFRETDRAVRVDFVAGFDDPAQSGSGDDPDLILPALAKIVILMLTGHWLEHREAVGKDVTHPVVMAADAILADLKVYR